MSNLHKKQAVLNLRREIADLDSQAATRRDALRSLQSECKHDWNPPVYAPIIREAFKTAGDPPGTMGVDWQGPVYVPREETPRWTRTCDLCDLTEVTQSTEDHIIKTPRF